MIVYDAQRRAIPLGEAVGHGGEATVYRVVSQPSRLAKIYEPEPRPNYTGKLDWMVRYPPENPTQSLEHASLAWPGGLLFDSKRRLKGYWMPYIQRTVPLLEVFNPRRRAEILPQFDRRYLLRTARNLAAALSALHRSGYVAGDLNESNVLVTPTALVTLIDTDSFQVTEERDGKLVFHPCPVGKLEYTPPELQGKSLAEVIRQPDHDAFGLAVLIFQLLMEGSHPFRAQWLAAGDPPPLEVRIANGAYPYVSSPTYPVLPPKNALGIDTLHPWLTELFYRAFVDGHRDPRWRPGPDLWVRALSEAEQAQVLCAEGHYYSSHLKSCPYCALIQKRVAQRPTNDRPPAGRAQPNRARTGWGASPFAQKRPAGAAVGAAAQAQAGPAPAAGQSGPASVPPSSGSAASSSASAAASAAAPPGSGSASYRPVNPSPFGSWPGVLAGASPSGSAAIFGFPPSSSRGVLRSRPVVQPGAMKNWVRQRAYKSVLVGGWQGALAGAIPGALIGLTSWSVGSLLAWTLLFSLGGAAGGLVRGWSPGHKLASLIDRYIGWKRFWEAIGLLAGAAVGTALGLVFIWAIIPVFLGLFLGAQSGFYLGRKIWQAGNLLGWEKIWAVLSAAGFGALGYGMAHLLVVVGLNDLGLTLGTGLLPYAANGSLGWAFVWTAAGGLGGALAGSLSGIFTDLLGRLTGLVD